MNANYYIGTYLCFYASNPPSYPKQLCGKCNHFEKCFNFLFKKKDMETKEVKIECPEGFEIDKEKSTFEKIVFKKKEKELPKTWSDYVNNFGRTQLVNYFRDNTISYNGVTLSGEHLEQLFTLFKLIKLRDCYNDGWKPDLNDLTQFKYTIFVNCGDPICYTNTQDSHVLAFKTRELRDEFYRNFKDLIEQAKELI